MRKNKRYIIISTLMVLALIIIGINPYGKYKYETGRGLSYEEKIRNIESLVSMKDYNKAEELNGKYFGNDSIYKDKIQICKDNKLTSFDEAEKFVQENKERLILNKITDTLKNDKSAYSNKDVTIYYTNQYINYLQEYNTDYDLVIDNLYELKRAYYKENHSFSLVLDNNVLVYNPKIGMSKKEVIALTKYLIPTDINKTTSSYGTSEQWCYDSYKYLYFDNDKLTSIQE